MDKTAVEAKTEGSSAESTCDTSTFLPLYENCANVFHDSTCMLRLARIYTGGKCGISKNEAVAFNYFQKCAEASGLPWCHFRTGEYIWSEKGGAVKDSEMAFNHFKLCARENGHLTYTNSLPLFLNSLYRS